MNVLLISNQPLLIESFLAYTRYSAPDINFITLPNTKQKTIHAVLIDAKQFHGKTLRKFISQNSFCPVFIIIDDDKKGSLFAVKGISGVFSYGFSKNRMIKAIRLFLDPQQMPVTKQAINVKEEMILGYLAKGASNKEIAYHLDIKPSAVKYHIRNLCQKMGVKNRTQAALRAEQISV